MQIVIDISEKIYEMTISNKFNTYNALDVLKAIKNGTPLPKGHGRLIDGDELENEIFHGGLTYYKKAKLIIDNAPTIIDADKENEE